MKLFLFLCNVVVITLVCALSAHYEVRAQSTTPITTQPTVYRGECGCESKALPDVLATVNSKQITGRDLEAIIKNNVQDAQRQVIEARRRQLDLEINSRLLDIESKKRGITRD